MKDIDTMNKTARSGKFASRAVVPQIVKSMANKKMEILDYGAGFEAIHTVALRNEGFKVTAYDIGNNNIGEIHDKDALKKKYDIVFASNVLNVQLDMNMLQNMILDILNVLKSKGFAVVNYPKVPRYMKDFDDEGMENFLMSFCDVTECVRVKKKYNGRIWMLRNK